MKIRQNQRTFNLRNGLFKIFLKSFFLLLCTSTMAFTLSNEFAQENIIIASDRSISVDEVFGAIKEQTNFRFIYKESMFKSLPNIAVKKGAITVDKLLEQTLGGKDYDIAFTDANTIIINKKTRKTEVQEPIEISGIVVDIDNNPLIGASISQKGTTRGTQTDFDGKFEITVSDENAVLMVSYIGFVPKEIPLNGQVEFTIQLEEDTAELNEVIVTALGIKKEKKAIGYSVDQIQQDELNSTGEPNVLLNLSAKAPGVQVSASSNGIDGSPRVIIRGVTSLSSDNQPLYVLDGLPLLSNRSLSESLFAPDNGQGDLGNPLSDINPNDIADITILKGASATALYGARGANGVIQITTKKGKSGQKGWGVSLSSSTTFQTPLLLPERQLQYGQGFNGEYSYVDGLGGGVRENDTRLWGPEYNGQPISQWDPETGGAVVKPWRSYGANNLNNFFETGHTFQQNISLTHVTEMSNMRLSLGHQDVKGIVPNTDLERITGSLNSSFRLGDKLTLDLVATGSTMKSANRDFFGNAGALLQILSIPTNIDIRDLRDYKDEFGNRRSFYNNGPNPYWNLYENLNPVDRQRFSTSVSLAYKLNDAFTLQGSLYQDTNITESQRIQAINEFNGGRSDGGYQERLLKNNEINADTRITFNKEIIENLDLNVIGGAAIRNERSSSNFARDAGGLVVRNIYNLGNSAQQPVVVNRKTEKEVQSVFGSMELNYKSFAFLTVTGRNDWSSTLPEDEWSFFYPSVSGSFVFTDAFNIKDSFLSFGKLRASWAKVGNDTQPYALDRFIQRNGNSFNGQPVLGLQNVIPATSLIPEESTSFEVGGELYFANNRIRLDVAYYENESSNQLIQVENAWERGARFAFINAGNIINKGLEIKLDLKPVETDNFTWNVNMNWSQNKGTVSGFPEDLVEFKIIGAFFGNEIRATNGEPYGNIIGFEYFRDSQESLERIERQQLDFDGLGYTAEDNIYGTGAILTRNGFPLTNTFRGAGADLGISAPFDWTAGISNSFRYKNFSLNFLIDFRNGGNVISNTNQNMSLNGLLPRSVGVNADGINIREAIDDGGGIIFEGIDVETGEANSINLRPQDLYSSFLLPTEDYTRDATNIKLRELSIGYNFDNDFVRNIGLTNLRISMIGRNLWLIKNNLNGIDTETANLGNLNNGAGFENGSLPNTKSLGFNVTVDF